MDIAKTVETTNKLCPKCKFGTGYVNTNPYDIGGYYLTCTFCEHEGELYGTKLGAIRSWKEERLIDDNKGEE